MGVSATVERAQKHFYFPGMAKVAAEVAKACQACQRREGPPKDQRHTLHSHQPGYPFQQVFMDFVGPLPKSTKGNEYLLTMKDGFSRWVEAFPLRHATAKAVVEKLTTEFIPRFGIPEQLHSDRGTQFTSNLVSDVAKMLGIRLTTTPAYNPKSNSVE